MSPRGLLARTLRVGLAAAAVIASAILPAAPAKAKAGGGSLPPWARDAAASPAPPTQGRVLWLLDEMEVQPLMEGGVRVTTRLVGRVLSPTGIESARRHGFARRQDDVVESYRAWNLLPDGKVETPEKSAYRDDPFTSSGSVHDDLRLHAVQVPLVVVGSVVAVETVIRESMDLGSQRFLFGSGDDATVLSRLTLRVPPGWSFDVARRRAEGVVEQRSASSVVLTARDLAPLPHLELAPPMLDRMPLAAVRWWNADGSRGYRDWDAVAKWFHALAEPVMADRGESAALGKAIAQDSTSDVMAGIARAFGFAARDVRYVSIQMGIGGFKPDSPARTCSQRHGDCKAKAFLVRSLISDMGLRTYPVIVRVRDAGKVLEEVPSPAEFNHAITAVALPDGAGTDRWATREVPGFGRLLFLDATASTASPWDLPPGDQGTSALLVHEAGGMLITLPVQPPEAGRVERRVEGKLDDQGTLIEARAVETRSGSEATTARAWLQRMDDAESARLRSVIAQRIVPGTTVKSATTQGLTDFGAPVVLTVELAGGKLGKRVHDMILIDPPRAGLVQEVLSTPRRPEPMVLGSPREEVWELTLDLPAGWVPETLPAPEPLVSKHLTVSSRWERDGGKLRHLRTVRVLSAEVPMAEQGDLRSAAEAANASSAALVLVQPGG